MLQNKKLTEYLIISIYIYLLMGKNKQKICHKKQCLFYHVTELLQKDHTLKTTTAAKFNYNSKYY